MLTNYSIFCNASAYGPNANVTWISSIDKITINVILNDSRITFSNNGQQINFASLVLPDQLYYACGIISAKFLVINQYFLYVRGKKKRFN